MSDSKKAKNPKKFSAPENNLDARFKRELKAACKPLTFISETDAEIIPFTVEKPASTSLESYIAALGVTSADIEEQKFDDLFNRLTTEKDWHRSRDKERRKNWSRLRTILEKDLQYLRVIRVGKIHLDIYVAGIDPSGRLAGVKTKAIET